MDIVRINKAFIIKHKQTHTIQCNKKALTNCTNYKQSRKGQRQIV